MKKLLSMASIGLILFSFSCKDDEALQRQPGPSTCAMDVICTEQFESLILRVSASDGKAVPLDKVVSTRSNGQAFEFKPEPWMGSDTSGRYVFWSDAELGQTRKEGEAIVVKGFYKGQEKFVSNLTVGHDCCHVLLLQGATDVFVQIQE